VAALARPVETVSAPEISPKDAKQETHEGPTTDRVGQKHCALEEHAEITLVMLAHSAAQLGICGQASVMTDERVEAAVRSPNEDKQETHEGPITDKVGQKHCG
jgi:hypothetical protein